MDVRLKIYKNKYKAERMSHFFGVGTRASTSHWLNHWITDDGSDVPHILSLFIVLISPGSINSRCLSVSCIAGIPLGWGGESDVRQYRKVDRNVILSQFIAPLKLKATTLSTAPFISYQFFFCSAQSVSHSLNHQRIRLRRRRRRRRKLLSGTNNKS